MYMYMVHDVCVCVYLALDAARIVHLVLGAEGQVQVHRGLLVRAHLCVCKLSACNYVQMCVCVCVCVCVRVPKSIVFF